MYTIVLQRVGFQKQYLQSSMPIATIQCPPSLYSVYGLGSSGDLKFCIKTITGFPLFMLIQSYSTVMFYLWQKDRMSQRSLQVLLISLWNPVQSMFGPVPLLGIVPAAFIIYDSRNSTLWQLSTALKLEGPQLQEVGWKTSGTLIRFKVLLSVTIWQRPYFLVRLALTNSGRVGGITLSVRQQMMTSPIRNINFIIIIKYYVIW